MDLVVPSKDIRKHYVCFMYVAMRQHVLEPPFTLLQALTPKSIFSISVFTLHSVKHLRNLEVLFPVLRRLALSHGGCVVLHLTGLAERKGLLKQKGWMTLFMSPLVYSRQNIQIAHVRLKNPLPLLCVLLLLIFFSHLKSLASVSPKIYPPDWAPGKTSGTGEWEVQFYFYPLRSFNWAGG